MDVLPERELYEIYAATISSRFAAFGVRKFEDARFDMAQILHTYDPRDSIDQALVDVIVTPDSHARFTEDLEMFIVKHGLRGWVDSGEALLFVTDHGQFTDVPVFAETLGRIGLGHRGTTVQVVSEMIADMRLDVGAGEFAVIDKLRNISAVVQTVPRLDGHPSDDLLRYRERKNDAALRVLEAARDTEGSMTVMSLVARHNTPSKNGNTLFIHEPNRRTLEGYARPYVKVVPVCIDCPTFRDDGTVEPCDHAVRVRASDVRQRPQSRHPQDRRCVPRGDQQHGRRSVPQRREGAIVASPDGSTATRIASDAGPPRTPPRVLIRHGIRSPSGDRSAIRPWRQVWTPVKLMP